MPAITKFTLSRWTIVRTRRIELSNRDPHLRRLISAARRQRRGLAGYRKFSTAYRSSSEDRSMRIQKDPGGSA